jgi:RNA-directed DNA polymerase
MHIVEGYIPDPNIRWLLKNIVDSFQSTGIGTGLPLGNLTSQLLVNVYMNEFDQYVKNSLKVQYYVRYADDFVVLSKDKKYLTNICQEFHKFLQEKLHLQLHPNKVYKTLASGVDFLGWVHFPKHRVLRTVTKKRMLRNIRQNPTKETVESYKTLLRHGNTYKLEMVADKVVVRQIPC